jgi:CDP-diacylglycerol--serine O-phosphatidyltransferase
MAMFCGFYSIASTLNGDYVSSAYAIMLAFVFDGIDGKIARLLNATSDFGVQMDSLSDLVSFGVAPSLLVYHWLLLPYGRVGWMAAFLFVACGALRLARFNVQTNGGESKYFVGLPIPAAAGVIASSVLFVKEIFGNPEDFTIPFTYVFLIYLLAFLMVSTLPYYSFKKIGCVSCKDFNLLVIFVLVIFIIGMYPEVMLFILMTTYVLSGLLLPLFKKKLVKSFGKTENKVS